MKSEILYRSRRDAHPDAIFFYLRFNSVLIQLNELRIEPLFFNSGFIASRVDDLKPFLIQKHKNINILYFQHLFVEQLFGTIWNNFFSETYNVILNNKTINTDFSDFSSFSSFHVICGTGIRFSSPPPAKSL